MMKLMIEVPEGSPGNVAQALQEIARELALHVHEDVRPRGRMGFRRPGEVATPFSDGEDAEHVPAHLVAEFNADGE